MTLMTPWSYLSLVLALDPVPFLKCTQALESYYAPERKASERSQKRSRQHKRTAQKPLQSGFAVGNRLRYRQLAMGGFRRLFKVLVRSGLDVIEPGLLIVVEASLASVCPGLHGF